MLTWLRRWISEAGAETPELQRLLAERRRLDELMASYREFGFQTLIPEYRQRRAAVDRKIRALRSA
jgi:hypothetical protein